MTGRRNLHLLHRAGLITAVPTRFQVLLGWLYMVRRLLFRPETIGVGQAPVRPTRWARRLAWRPIRLPFLLWERAIAPLDLVGFSRSPAFLERHLLGAFHAEDQALYDLALLAPHPGRLTRLRERVAEVVAEETPRARWLADLCVFEGYHPRLLRLVDRALAGDFTPEVDARPADVTLRGFVDWCLAQPPSPGAWLAGEQAPTS